MLKDNITELLNALAAAQEKGNYASVARHYLELEKTYKDEGKTAEAIHYLNRFDNLVSGVDDLYETFENEDDLAME